MIEVEGVTKRYGDKLAVEGLTFTVEPGIVTGFLGPNGAGKSTTMRMIVGLDAPTAGAMSVKGRAYRSFAAPLHEVGAMLEARAIHTGRSAYHHLVAMAQTQGIGRDRVEEVIDLVGLQVARKRVGGFSLRAVVGTALFLTVLGALAVGLGALVRSTAGGIAMFVFLLFVLPGITGILPASVSASVNPYLPLNAGFAVTTSTFENGHHLAPWTGFALFCGYAVVVLVAAAVALVRRDA